MRTYVWLIFWLFMCDDIFTFAFDRYFLYNNKEQRHVWNCKNQGTKLLTAIVFSALYFKVILS
jgi:hypothetical protein